jgi:beta-lactamase regulating signal transducer with metallopeptidase domain
MNFFSFLSEFGTKIETFRALLVMSITGSVVAALLLLVKPLVKSRLPKAAQYYLWLVVIAAFLVPFSRLVLLPLNTAETPTIAGTVDWYVADNAEIFERVKPYAVTAPDGVVGYPDENMAIIDDLVPEPWIVGLIDWLKLIWVLGAYTSLTVFACSYYRFILLLKRNNAATDIPCKIPVYRNAEAATPMLIGLFRPAIVLPDRGYTDEQLRAVLLHELTHLRRRDILVKWLSVLACSLHWFNPLVWLARRELDRACELACDEAVIAGLGADGRQAYGDTLIAVAADAKIPRVVLSTTMYERKKSLKERLGSIMAYKRTTTPAVLLSAALIVLVGVGAVLLGAGSGERTMDDIIAKAPHFSGIITEIYENSILIRVNDGEAVLSSSDLIDVSLLDTHSDSQTRFYVGDEVVVYYDGMIAETYPGRADHVYAVTTRNPAWAAYADYAALSALKTPYVGDNSAVSKIVSLLPVPDSRLVQRFISIGDDYGTAYAPNTLTLYYEPRGAEIENAAAQYLENDGAYLKNAVLLFALIDNLDEVSFAVRDSMTGGSALDKGAYTSYQRLSRYEVTLLLEINIEDLWDGGTLSVADAFRKTDEIAPFTRTDSADTADAAEIREVSRLVIDRYLELLTDKDVKGLAQFLEIDGDGSHTVYEAERVIDYYWSRAGRDYNRVDNGYDFGTARLTEMQFNDNTYESLCYISVDAPYEFDSERKAELTIRLNYGDGLVGPDITESGCYLLPEEIRNITSATLFLPDGTQRTIEYADKEKLEWLESNFAAARDMGFSAGCPFGAKLLLERGDDRSGIVFPAMDSCTVFNSGGISYEWDDPVNTEFWQLFGMDGALPDAKP